MNYTQASSILMKGGRIHRRCWQPGWLELGPFQDKYTIFYRNPAPIMVAGYEMPAIYVTYIPNREDHNAKDWEEVK